MARRRRGQRCGRCPHAPVRTSQIRALEHAAALAWPGTEQQWLDGWLLRAGDGTLTARIPLCRLAFEAGTNVGARDRRLVRARGLPPWLSVPDRLLPVPRGVPPHLETW